MGGEECFGRGVYLRAVELWLKVVCSFYSFNWFLPIWMRGIVGISDKCPFFVTISSFFCAIIRIKPHYV